MLSVRIGAVQGDRPYSGPKGDMEIEEKRREFAPAASQAPGMAGALPSFCCTGYRQLLQGFLTAGYEVVGFDTIQKDRRHVIVRHDVDLTMEAAVRMAEIENAMGVKAIYFVMVGGSFYNIFTRQTRHLLKRLIALGHGVGLHFDIDPYAQAGDDDILAHCQQAIAHESDLLATVIGAPVDIVSFHKPIPAIINHEHPVGGRPHTYEPRFMSDIAYVSDSRGQWRFGSPFDHEAFRNGTAMQLLTHPIWWDRDEPLAPEVALQGFVAERHGQFEIVLAENCQPYRAVLTQRARK